MARRRCVYEGREKDLYEGPSPGLLVQHFKDSAWVRRPRKVGVIDGKGVINNRISEYLMTRLTEIRVPTNFVRRLNMREQLVHEVEVLPVEVMVRNIAAGEFAEKFSLKEGTVLPRSIIEFYLRSDDLADPLVSEEHMTAFGLQLLGSVVRATDERTGRVDQLLVRAGQSSALRVADAMCRDQDKRGGGRGASRGLGRLAEPSLGQPSCDEGVVKKLAVDRDQCGVAHGPCGT